MTYVIKADQAMIDAALDAYGNKDLSKWRKERIGTLQPFRDAAAGGERAKSLLSRGSIETPEEFNNRSKRFRNVPLCGFGAAAHSWLLYGQPNTSRYWLIDQPIPDVISQVMAARRGEQLEGFEDSQQINEWFKDIKDENNWGILAVDAAYNRVRDGLSAAKIWTRYSPTQGIDSVGIGIMNCEDVYAIYNPEDPAVILAVAEARIYGTGSTQTVRWRLWTATEWHWINEDGTFNEAGENHSFGRPPFAFLGDGRSMLTDAILDQKELIQRESVRLAITQSQGFSYFQVNGQPLDDGASGTDAAAGGVRGVGTDRMFWFKDKEGSIQFVNPNAPLEEHRAAFEALLVNAFRVSLMLPGDLVSGSTTPEQPTSIQWHWLISKIAYSGLVREATAWEDDITRILEPIASAVSELPSFEVGQLDWEHTFRENPIPTEALEERAKDQTDVNSGNMHKAHYISKWILPNGSPEEIKVYLDELDAAKATAAQAIRGVAPTAPVIPAIQNRLAMMGQGNGSANK